MEQYVFHPALLPHMSNQDGAELSVWGRERESEAAETGEREQMGFYARVSHESHLFSRLNICKFHLQSVGQSFQHQRPQFYGLPTLKIFWWEIALSLSVLHRWGFYKADLQSNVHQIRLWWGITLQFIEKTGTKLVPCGKTPYIPIPIIWCSSSTVVLVVQQHYMQTNSLDLSNEPKQYGKTLPKQTSSHSKCQCVRLSFQHSRRVRRTRFILWRGSDSHHLLILAPVCDQSK